MSCARLPHSTSAPVGQVTAKEDVERPVVTGRQLAFEVASRVIAGVGITIGVVRRIRAAIVYSDSPLDDRYAMSAKR